MPEPDFTVLIKTRDAARTRGHDFHRVQNRGPFAQHKTPIDAVAVGDAETDLDGSIAELSKKHAKRPTRQGAELESAHTVGRRGTPDLGKRDLDAWYRECGRRIHHHTSQHDARLRMSAGGVGQRQHNGRAQDTDKLSHSRAHAGLPTGSAIKLRLPRTAASPTRN